MKSLFFALLLIFFYSFGYSQTKTNIIDNRLLEKYSKTELQELQKNNPNQLIYLTYCLDYAWYITDLPKEKMNEKNGRIREINIENINKINFYALNIEILNDDYQYFAIKGTDKLLVVKSEKHIKKEIK